MKQEGDPFTQPEELSAPSVVIASFDSTCVSCFDEIQVGDSITLDEFGFGGWRHRSCREVLDLVRTCGQCFTKPAANGACNCD